MNEELTETERKGEREGGGEGEGEIGVGFGLDDHIRSIVPHQQKLQMATRVSRNRVQQMTPPGTSPKSRIGTMDVNEMMVLEDPGHRLGGNEEEEPQVQGVAVKRNESSTANQQGDGAEGNNGEEGAEKKKKKRIGVPKMTPQLLFGEQGTETEKKRV
eukprot:TRINITY_DN1032_c0_g2_i5.p2 TRINITY_DN1032_c0_g2~~TRINITY_DN1032_c0_g2_i5.p2  ORF type:complete len:158 (-),score=32.80 TRINITY_DN1032_c0_g2_i5:16-489(-)